MHPQDKELLFYLVAFGLVFLIAFGVVGWRKNSPPHVWVNKKSPSISAFLAALEGQRGLVGDARLIRSSGQRLVSRPVDELLNNSSAMERNPLRLAPGRRF